MSRKRSISALLNENPRKKIKKTKVACSCNECNESLVDQRTRFSHRYRQKKKEKKQTTNQEFTFWFRKRNAALNRIMSFDTDQRNSTINSISIYSNSEPDDESEPDNDAESNESFEFDDIYEDYSAPAFELSSHHDVFTNSRFMWILL